MKFYLPTPVAASASLEKHSKTQNARLFARNLLFDGSEYVGNFVVTTGSTKTVRAMRMYIAESGAFGRNTYLAISDTSVPIDWNQVPHLLGHLCVPTLVTRGQISSSAQF